MPENFSLTMIIQFSILLIIGFIAAKLLSSGIVKASGKHLNVHHQMILRRLIYYIVLVLFLFSALQQLGFKLNALLGAAGIFTVAIGFASQTSVSNIISGLFLIFERSFVVGDVLQVGKNTGEVVTIDLLSTKLKTFDNLYIRISNESLIKSDIINYSHYPIRRFDLQLGIAYKEDIEKVRGVLFELAANNEHCLKKPAPNFLIKGFGESSVDLQFSLWAKKENFGDLKFTFQVAVKKQFDKQKIEIPFPQREIRILDGG